MTTTVSTISFDKYHVQGNDYVILKEEALENSFSLENARELCDRRFGIGADGVIISRGVDFYDVHQVSFFNSNGTECGKSGNGLIIYACWLETQSYVVEDKIVVSTKGGLSTIKKLHDKSFGVNLGISSFNTSLLGLSEEQITCEEYELNTPVGKINVCSLFNGNPHTIVFTLVEQEKREIVAKFINESSMFVFGTNVQFITEFDKYSAVIDIWERGAGNTSSSGSGASAAAMALVNRKLCHSPVTIRMNGGSMVISIDDDGCVWQRAFATRLFSGELNVDILKNE